MNKRVIDRAIKKTVDELFSPDSRIGFTVIQGKELRELGMDREVELVDLVNELGFIFKNYVHKVLYRRRNE